MTFLTIAFPVETAVPVAQAFAAAAASAIRPLLGLGVFATLLMIFKPLVVGVLRAALLVLKPRESIEQRTVRSRLRGVLTLNNMANELESSQPNVASELRALASRD